MRDALTLIARARMAHPSVLGMMLLSVVLGLGVVFVPQIARGEDGGMLLTNHDLFASFGKSALLLLFLGVIAILLKRSQSRSAIEKGAGVRAMAVRDSILVSRSVRLVLIQVHETLVLCSITAQGVQFIKEMPASGATQSCVDRTLTEAQHVLA